MSGAPATPTPDAGGWLARVRAFDDRADAALEPLRRRRVPALVFRTATRLADFSLIWLLTGAAYSLAVERSLVPALWFAALILVESLVVNQGIKRLFRRTRPTVTGDPRFTVRTPRTTSFPSGHASSAFYAAVLLTAWSGWGWAPLWFVMALIVTTSRPFVRIHHASDVVAGAAVGVVLAAIALAAGALDLLR